MQTPRSVAIALLPVVLLLGAAQAHPGVATGAGAAPVAPGERCGRVEAGERCAPGHGRRTVGGAGTGKVSHKGWPATTGVLWLVTSEGRSPRAYAGGHLNDKLLGRHGDDTIAGGRGKDVLWGDWDAKRNTTAQRDVLDGGPGDDWIHSSHGANTIRAGSGDDHVRAYYGRGSIDCGPGRDLVRVRLGAPYRIRNCEQIRNFCAFGSKPRGGCYKPGETPAARSRTNVR